MDKRIDEILLIEDEAARKAAALAYCGETMMESDLEFIDCRELKTEHLQACLLANSPMTPLVLEPGAISESQIALLKEEWEKTWTGRGRLVVFSDEWEMIEGEVVDGA